MSSMLAYNIVGEGKPVVMLHGFLENKNMWNFLQYNDENNLQSILIDLPGHGNSTCYTQAHTMTFMADKVLEVLDHENIQEFHLLGHSMGGYVSLDILEQKPERVLSLGLLFSHPFEDTTEKKRQRLRASETVAENKDTFVKLGVRNLFNPHKINDLQKEIEEAIEMGLTTSLKGIQSALLGMRARKDTSANLNNQNLPTLWIYGEYDSAVDKDRVKKFLKDKDFIQDYELPIGHMGHLEAPEICSTIVHQFYNDL